MLLVDWHARLRGCGGRADLRGFGHMAGAGARCADPGEQCRENEWSAKGILHGHP